MPADSPTHVHWWQPIRPAATSRKAGPPRWPAPLRCEVCGVRAHPAACYDDDGRLECCCGLTALEDREAEDAGAQLGEGVG